MKPPRKFFPDPRGALDEGLVDVRDEISNEILIEAYRNGIFPWPQEGLPILWFSPPERGVLDFADLHIPRSLKKVLSRGTFEITFDQAFERVLHECQSQPRPGQSGTWITDKLIRAYLEFHDAGYAHSVEAWEKGRLVGGLYGVFVDSVFCGESMFFHEPDASKVALIALIEKLKSFGLQWMDIQMVTPVLKSLGGKYISRDEYLTRLDLQRDKGIKVVWSERS